MRRRFAITAAFSLLVLGCSPASPAPNPPPALSLPHAHVVHAHHRAGHGPHGAHVGHPAAAPAASSDLEARLLEVARAHGGTGPWAVAGYRMGEHAIRALGVERGSFDLEIVHHTPAEVQYSCIADGAAAATGASLGKLNLTLADATAPETRTVYRRHSTGQAITLRVTGAFAERFGDVAREGLATAGREVMQLSDDEIFEAVP